jgi:hypothetical protein
VFFYFMPIFISVSWDREAKTIGRIWVAVQKVGQLVKTNRVLISLSKINTRQGAALSPVLC